MKKNFYSNGKLLITGEYVVLDGATALALPTKFGQSLSIEEVEKPEIFWKSIDNNGNVWFEATFENTKSILNRVQNEDTVRNTLCEILSAAKALNPEFLSSEKGCHITTVLDFPQNWGLGTSSTLVNNIAQWAQVDAFTLLENSFGGSGYDIASAQHNMAIFYERGLPPSIREVHLPWEFKDQIFFVHLNQKQDSKEGIARYRTAKVSEKNIQKISDLTQKLLMCYDLESFIKLMESHEKTISEIINLPTVKEKLFSDYPGLVKSLGAWGGDFVLVTGSKKDMDYFARKGYTTIVPYREMVKKHLP